MAVEIGRVCCCAEIQLTREQLAAKSEEMLFLPLSRLPVGTCVWEFSVCKAGFFATLG